MMFNTKLIICMNSDLGIFVNAEITSHFFVNSVIVNTYSQRTDNNSINKKK